MKGRNALVYAAVRRIPRGRVATYGQIARMAGLQNGARTVGWAMRALPDDHRIGGRAVPWHRVINARGTISLRGDGADGAAARQRRALVREGIEFLPGGRVDLERRLWSGRRGPR